MEEISCTDFYEIAWYITQGAEIRAIEAYRLNKNIVCRVYVVSPAIARLQALYFQGKAEVNLFEFRRAYSQVNAFASEAKSKYRRQQQQEKAAGNKALSGGQL